QVRRRAPGRGPGGRDRDRGLRGLGAGPPAGGHPAGDGGRRSLLRLSDPASRVPGALSRGVPPRGRVARGGRAPDRAAHAEARLSRPATRARLLGLLRPHAGLLVAGFATAALASLLQGVTILILDPLLKQLFSTGLGVGGASWLERLMPRLLEPILAGRTGAAASARLVALFLVALAVQVVAGYVSAYLSVLAQENIARDLRTRLWEHLLRLDLSVFQQTRGGQVAAALVTDADQVKQLIVAALAAFFQNLVLILVLVATMIGYSW